MISIDRVITFAKAQGFKVKLENGTLVLVDQKGESSILLEDYQEGDGVSKDLEEQVRNLC